MVGHGPLLWLLTLPLQPRVVVGWAAVARVRFTKRS